MKIAALTTEQLNIILTTTTYEAARRLDISEGTIRYIKGRAKSKKAPINYQLPSVQEYVNSIAPVIRVSGNRPWSKRQDQFLLKMAGSGSVEFMATFLKRGPEETKSRLEHLLSIERKKIPLDTLLTDFPDLTQGQQDLMMSIYSYDPIAAREYCRIIKRKRTESLAHVCPALSVQD